MIGGMDWSARLKEAIRDRDWSAAELARKSGVSYDSVVKYLAGGVDNPRGDTLRRLAGALNVGELWLKDGVGTAKEFGVPVTGYIGAGGEVIYLDDYQKGDGFDRVAPPPNAPPNAVALMVRGDSMRPFIRDGWCIVYWNRFDDPSPLFGEMCVVRLTSGETYLKELRPGLRRGKFRLDSFNADPMEEVEVEWAAEIAAIYPRVNWL